MKIAHEVADTPRPAISPSLNAAYLASSKLLGARRVVGIRYIGPDSLRNLIANGYIKNAVVLGTPALAGVVLFYGFNAAS